MKVFIDSSVLIAACSSRYGLAALILSLCKKGILRGYISKYVLVEVRRNVSRKLSEKQKNRLNVVVTSGRLLMVHEPPADLIRKCTTVVPEKDAPVFAAALLNQSDFLVTLDRKHFKKETVKKFDPRLKIVTPEEMLALLDNK